MLGRMVEDAPPPVPPTAPTPPPRAANARAASTRFETCRCILYCVPSGGDASAPVETEYRRCPVGLIAAVDCPEFSGSICRVYADRGEAPRQIVLESELPLLAAELAREGYPSERYLRRNRPLWTNTPAVVRDGDLAAPVPARAPEDDPTHAARIAEEVRAARSQRAPINVPSDASSRILRARQGRGGKRPIPLRDLEGDPRAG
jgi:hypothetical protein